MRRLLSKPDGQVGLLRGQVSEIDFEGLLVHAAHVLNAVLVRVDAILLEVSDKTVKGLHHELDDLLFL